MKNDDLEITGATAPKLSRQLIYTHMNTNTSFTKCHCCSRRTWSTSLLLGKSQSVMIINTLNLGNFREGNEKADLANNQSWVRHCARKHNAEPCPSILTSGRSFWLENSQRGRRLPIDHSGSGTQVSLACQANARSCAKAPPAIKSMTTPGGPVFSTKEPRVKKMFKHHSS